jgi:heme exporter protein A
MPAPQNWSSALAAKPLFEFQELAFERNDRPLFEGLSASLYEGDILQVSGANGSGKTTLLRVLSSLQQPSDGCILWRGEDTSKITSLFVAEIAFIGHLPGIKSGLSVRENLDWYCQLHDLYDAEDINASLDRVGLGNCKDQICSTLSTGQMRRVALAALYLRQARLWLLDEPLTGLDIGGVRDMETLFSAHVKGGGIVIFSSHQEISLSGIRDLHLGDYSPGAKQ